MKDEAVIPCESDSLSLSPPPSLPWQDSIRKKKTEKHSTFSKKIIIMIKSQKCSQKMEFKQNKFKITLNRVIDKSNPENLGGKLRKGVPEHWA